MIDDSRVWSFHVSEETKVAYVLLLPAQLHD